MGGLKTPQSELPFAVPVVNFFGTPTFDFLGVLLFADLLFVDFLSLNLLLSTTLLFIFLLLGVRSSSVVTSMTVLFAAAKVAPD